MEESLEAKVAHCYPVWPPEVIPATQQNDWVSPKMSMDRSGKGGLRDNYGYANNFTKPSYTNLYKAMMNP